MSLRPLASLLVKILGLYTVVQSLNLLGLVWIPISDLLDDRITYSPIGPFPNWSDTVPGLIVGVLQILAGIGLMWFSDGIAHLMIKDKDDDSHLSSFNEQWKTAGIGVVGVYLLADSVSRVLLFIGLFLSREGGRGLPSFAIAALVRALIGLWLLLGARGIVRGTVNLKNIGRDADD